MEIKEILTNLFRDQRLNDCITKISSTDQAEDLKQDVFIVLLTKDPEVINSLHKENGLLFYAIRIAKNLSRTENRKRKTIPLCEVAEEIEHDEVKEYTHLLDELPKTNNGFPYFKEVFNIVAKHGSLRAASRVTGIPFSSIQVDWNFVKTYLKSYAR